MVSGIRFQHCTYGMNSEPAYFATVKGAWRLARFSYRFTPDQLAPFFSSSSRSADSPRGHDSTGRLGPARHCSHAAAEGPTSSLLGQQRDQVCAIPGSRELRSQRCSSREPQLREVPSS